jgi:hypothetical protein
VSTSFNFLPFSALKLAFSFALLNTASVAVSLGKIVAALEVSSASKKGVSVGGGVPSSFKYP